MSVVVVAGFAHSFLGSSHGFCFKLIVKSSTILIPSILKEIYKITSGIFGTKAFATVNVDAQSLL